MCNGHVIDKFWDNKLDVKLWYLHILVKLTNAEYETEDKAGKTNIGKIRNALIFKSKSIDLVVTIA